MTEPVETLAPQAEATPVAPTSEPEAAPAADVAPEGTAPAEPANALDRALAEPEAPIASPSTYPADWQKEMAGGDEKTESLLKRYDSPKGVAQAFRELQKKISSGDFSRAKPEEEGEVMAWRKERGIPDDPSGYDLNDLGNGLVVGEEDKPIIDGVLAAMHSADATPAQVKSTVSAYYAAQESMLAEQSQLDKSDGEKAIDAMRAEWGPDFRPNMNQLKGFLDSAPDGVGELLINGRLGNGQGIMNNEASIRWLSGIAKERNPMGTLVPAGGDASASIVAEIASIEATMATEPEKYYGDQAMQARYEDLLAGQERLAK